jgi:hypothetical protein
MKQFFWYILKAKFLLLSLYDDVNINKENLFVLFVQITFEDLVIVDDTFLSLASRKVL